jgi:hypothetical protein
MTRPLSLAVAGFLAAAAIAIPVTSAEASAAETSSSMQTRSAVGAERAARFMDRYFRHANRDEWRWVRQHSNRRMKRAVPLLRANSDHGNYRRHGRCVGYDESDHRTCGYSLAGSLMGEIDVRRRADKSMVAIRHVIYS